MIRFVISMPMHMQEQQNCNGDKILAMTPFGPLGYGTGPNGGNGNWSFNVSTCTQYFSLLWCES